MPEAVALLRQLYVYITGQVGKGIFSLSALAHLLDCYLLAYFGTKAAVGPYVYCHGSQTNEVGQVRILHVPHCWYLAQSQKAQQRSVCLDSIL